MRIIMVILALFVGHNAFANAKQDYLLKCKGTTMIVLLNEQPKTDQAEMKKYATEVCDMGIARIKESDLQKYGGDKLGCMDGTQFAIYQTPEPARTAKRQELWKNYCKI